MSVLRVQFSQGVKIMRDLAFQSVPESFVSEGRFVDLAPVKVDGFKLEPIQGTITANLLPDDAKVYDDFGCSYFRAMVDDEKILLKFAFGKYGRVESELEAKAYCKLTDLQGSVIPKFKGLYNVIDDPATMCFITSDVGNSLPPVGALDGLPKEDREAIARLVSQLCTYDLCVVRLGRDHILQGNGQYWLHNLREIQKHETCYLGSEPKDGGQSETNRLLEEFQCRDVQFFLREMRLLDWPPPRSVLIDGELYEGLGLPSQKTIDALWRPEMKEQSHHAEWYGSIKEFMDKNNLDPEKEIDMKTIVAYSQRRRDEMALLLPEIVDE